MEDVSYNEVNTSLGTISTDSYNYINNLMSNPTIIIILVIVIVIYLVVFFSLGGSNGESTQVNSSSEGISNSSSTILTIIVVAIFFILIVVNGLQYFFSINIFAKVKDLLTGSPEVDIIIDQTNQISKAPIPEIMLRPQVFNIPGNEYVYSDAKAVCQAYGARLANYKELEESYNKGGEWCNYGWSEGQMALYPTQQKTFDELQKIEGHENDCGRPGINGGYIANPKVKFGINCFGYKPKMNSTEEELMASEPIYPKTLKDIAMENRVKYWQDKLTEILVSPFNNNTWSKI